MHYRLYFMDLAGHIRHALDLQCEDDAQAAREVEKHRNGQAMELWQASRLVRRYAAASAAPGRSFRPAPTQSS